MKNHPIDNPFKRQLQLESQFALAMELKKDRFITSEEFLKLIISMTREFFELQNQFDFIEMRWDFGSEEIGQIAMQATLDNCYRERRISNLQDQINWLNSKIKEDPLT